MKKKHSMPQAYSSYLLVCLFAHLLLSVRFNIQYLASYQRGFSSIPGLYHWLHLNILDKMKRVLVSADVTNVNIMWLRRSSDNKEDPELRDSGGPHGHIAVWRHCCAHTRVWVVQRRQKVNARHTDTTVSTISPVQSAKWRWQNIQTLFEKLILYVDTSGSNSREKQMEALGSSQLEIKYNCHPAPRRCCRFSLCIFLCSSPTMDPESELKQTSCIQQAIR